MENYKCKIINNGIITLEKKNSNIAECIQQKIIDSRIIFNKINMKEFSSNRDEMILKIYMNIIGKHTYFFNGI